ncbi:hypothetical protein RCL1_004960 [Eukaryota sp. TZLM3-RCL]
MVKICSHPKCENEVPPTANYKNKTCSPLCSKRLSDLMYRRKIRDLTQVIERPVFAPPQDHVEPVLKILKPVPLKARVSTPSPPTTLRPNIAVNSPTVMPPNYFHPHHIVPPEPHHFYYPANYLPSPPLSTAYADIHYYQQSHQPFHQQPPPQHRQVTLRVESLLN